MSPRDELHTYLAADTGDTINLRPDCDHCQHVAGTLGIDLAATDVRIESRVRDADGERLHRYAEAIWTASQNDEGTISATGAQVVARAVMSMANGEQQQLRANVLHFHRAFDLYEPCESEVTGCEHAHCVESAATGEWYHEDRPAGRACSECRDEDGAFVAWPCDTARAVGVAS